MGVSEAMKTSGRAGLFPKAEAGIGVQSGYDLAVTCPTGQSSLPENWRLSFILDEVSCS